MLNMIFFEKVLEVLPTIRHLHARTSPIYQLLAQVVREKVETVFREGGLHRQSFGSLGEIIFPFFKMGERSSLDLFDLDELILFSFYQINKNKYRRVLDLGANIGLHSVMLGRCGFDVISYEPDPIHFEQLERNLSLNRISQVNPIRAAASSKGGTAEFVRVLGNTTSSHLAGSKESYGQLERFQVSVVGIGDMLDGIDLMKMDVEGHEAEILLAMRSADWDHLDAIVEVGSPQKAALIHQYMQQSNVGCFAQKIGWNRVKSLADMPTSYKEGSLFISKKEEMPWGDFQSF